MPIPSKRKDEDKSNFMSRCMSDPKMTSEYPDSKQRTAICISKATEGLDYVEAGDFAHYLNRYGYTEQITQENLYVPEDNEYLDFEEESEEWNWASEYPDLLKGIRQTKDAEGDDLKNFTLSGGKFEYEDPKTGEVYRYSRKGIYRKNGRFLVFKGEASLHYSQSAVYQGKAIKLYKPFKTPDGTKSYSVYVKDEENKIVKVNFGNSYPEVKNTVSQKKSFQLKNNCSYPGPKSKARYWCCKSFS